MEPKLCVLASNSLASVNRCTHFPIPTGPWYPQGIGIDVSDTVLFIPAGQSPISCLYFGESYSPKSLESGFSESQ